MRVEDYFEFLSPNEIKLKGHRIWIEHILYEHIHNAKTPDELAVRFPTLSLEQIYATLLYYQQHKDAMHTYLTNWLEHYERMHAEQTRNPSPTILKIRAIKAEREATERQAL